MQDIIQELVDVLEFEILHEIRPVAVVGLMTLRLIRRLVVRSSTVSMECD